MQRPSPPARRRKYSGNGSGDEREGSEREKKKKKICPASLWDRSRLETNMVCQRCLRMVSENQPSGDSFDTAVLTGSATPRSWGGAVSDRGTEEAILEVTGVKPTARHRLNMKYT